MDRDQAFKMLMKPFDPKLIDKLPRATINADEYKKLTKVSCDICGGYHPKASTIHLDYTGHAAVTQRLLEVDPEWNWEPIAIDCSTGAPTMTPEGGMWIKLTILGVTRRGYGNATMKFGPGKPLTGDVMKELIGDAIRNGAMRFGVALDDWSKSDLHAVDPTPDIDVTPEVPETLPFLTSGMKTPWANAVKARIRDGNLDQVLKRYMISADDADEIERQALEYGVKNDTQSS